MLDAQASSDETPLEQQAQPARYALIFVPGMGDVFIDQSVDGIGSRIADALNREAASGQARFAVNPEVREETFGQARTTAACTIVRTDGGEETAAVDVYRLDGVRALRGRAEGGFLRKALLPILVLMSWIPRALKARKAQGKSLRERRQLDYAVAVLVLLSVYLVILLATGVVTVLNAFDPDLLDRVPVLGERALSIWQAIVLGLTTLGLWKSSHISALTSGAVGYIAVAGYLDRGDRRDNLVGEVAGLLEHIEEGKVDYEQVDMIAFSFGSIAALDAFFPEDAEPGPRFGKVRTLVTIGCPFDFVRTYWPTHFAGRVITGPGPAAWLNVYTPIDVLSSNFRDDTSTGPATVGIPIDSGNVRKPQNLAFRRGKTLEAMTRWEFWTFAALSSHSIYWGRKAESEDSVFRSIAPHLYKGETILG